VVPSSVKKAASSHTKYDAMHNTQCTKVLEQVYSSEETMIDEIVNRVLAKLHFNRTCAKIDMIKNVLMSIHVSLAINRFCILSPLLNFLDFIRFLGIRTLE